MDKHEALNLAGFNAWANGRVLAKAARFPFAALKNGAGLSYPSPLSTLVHILDVQRYWREGAQTGLLPPHKLEPEQFAGMAALRRRWKQEDLLFAQFVRGLTDEQLAGEVTYAFARARPRTRPMADLIQHIVLHGTQHRSELAAWLTAKKLSPGGLGYLRFASKGQQ
jgi:uncharacterized damage-inducible protein DinB